MGETFIRLPPFLIEIKKLVAPPLQFQCATDISKSKFTESRDQKWDLLKKFVRVEKKSTGRKIECQDQEFGEIRKL